MGLLEIREEHSKAQEKFNKDYRLELSAILKEVGITEGCTCVHDNFLNKNGVLKITQTSYGKCDPYEFNFYPIKKDGSISLNSRGFFMISSRHTNEQIVTALKERYKIIGEYTPKV